MSVRSEGVYAALARHGIELAAPTAPAAAYVSYTTSGDLVFLSGHLAMKDGGVHRGKLGENMDTQQGRLAARGIVLDLLATLHGATGDLNQVEQIVKVMSLVNSAPDYTEQHLVTNGASEFLLDVFGAQAGAHARSAFGVVQLPMGACVEIEMIVRIRRN